jgi:hypothetical protein
MRILTVIENLGEIEKFGRTSLLVQTLETIGLLSLELLRVHMPRFKKKYFSISALTKGSPEDLAKLIPVFDCGYAIVKQP